jgi:hypothetical protein
MPPSVGESAAVVVWMSRSTVAGGDVRALRSLAAARLHFGDVDGGAALFLQAADGGDVAALRDLGGLRKQAGDVQGADAFYRRAADGGDVWSLAELARIPPLPTAT